MAKRGRRKADPKEKGAVCDAFRAALDAYIEKHPDLARAEVARIILGISPQHLDRITSRGIAPNAAVLSRAAHFFEMTFEFRGHRFTPQSFLPPSSPEDGHVYAKQLKLTFDQPVDLSGAEVTMRVVQKTEEYWQVEIRLSKAWFRA